MTVTVFLMILVFMRLSGFRFKISSLLFGIEFGPAEPTVDVNLLKNNTNSVVAIMAHIEEINKKLEISSSKNLAIKPPTEKQKGLKIIENLPDEKGDKASTSSEDSFDLIHSE